MADPSKTEKATPKRRGEARSKGQVAKSVELNSFAVLAGAVAALVLFGPRIFRSLLGIVAHGLAQSGRGAGLVSADGLPSLGKWALLAFLGALAPILILTALSGVLANVAQVRFKVTPKAIQPKWASVSPLAGFKRLASPRSLVELAKSLAKLAIVGGVAFLAVWPKLPELGALVGLPPGLLLPKLGGIVVGIALRAVAAFGLIGILDYVYQRRTFDKNLRMTKDEVKREARDADLPPELRGAIRRKQMEASRKRMLQAVPTADVVVTNPTHYAVALRYDGTRPAPEVVAKGADHLALRIREIAREHDVPVLENPPLARALYREVELDEMIPEEFFAAVAEVLAFVFRTARRRGRRALLGPA